MKKAGNHTLRLTNSTSKMYQVQGIASAIFPWLCFTTEGIQIFSCHAGLVKQL